MIVYVYHDADHNQIEVFTKLISAKDCAEQNWPNEDGDMKWERSGGDKWLWGEYVSIYKKEVSL